MNLEYPFKFRIKGDDFFTYEALKAVDCWVLIKNGEGPCPCLVSELAVKNRIELGEWKIIEDKTEVKEWAVLDKGYSDGQGWYVHALIQGEDWTDSKAKAKEVCKGGKDRYIISRIKKEN